MVDKMVNKKIDNKKVAEALVKKLDKKISDRSKWIKAAMAVVASAGLTGCTTFGASNMFSDSDRGFVMIAGDAEGIRAYNDGINGIISNTRVSKDTKSPYWQNREVETEVRTFRTPYYSPSHPRFSAQRQRSVTNNQQQQY